jgi:RecA-family ATPase
MFNSDWYPAFQEPDNAFERFGERAMFATWCIERIPREEWLAPPKQNREEAERFLALLDSDARAFTFQVFDDDPERKDDKLARVLHGPLDKYWPEFVSKNNNRIGVYVTINETDMKGRTAKNVVRVRALFVDLDGSSLEPVIRSEPKPHLVVESSPGRFHVYWFVTGIELDQFESLQRMLAQRFDGDRVVDLPRVLRLPGFFHHKGERFLSRIVSVQRHLPLYTAADFDASNRSINVVEFFSAADAINREHASKSETQRLNDLAIKHYAAWVPEIFPNAKRKDNGGYRVSSAKLGRENEEDLSFHPDGIKDFGVHDLADPREGKRTPIDIVMEYVLDVPIEEIAARSNTLEFEKAQEWLRKRLPKQEEKKDKLPELEFFHLDDLRRHPLVGRQWICRDFILAGQLNGLFGDGGVGKDLLLLMLAMSVTSEVQWLGRDVKQGRVLYFPTEDDLDELRRRENDITEFYKTEEAYRSAPKQLRIVPMVGKDTVIAVFDSRSGLVRAMPLYVSICNMIEEFKPDLVIMPNRVNCFGVNQNDDAQARQCMNLLQSICVEYKTAVTLPGHVSLGQRSTEGTSGSVQWSNACRMRTYLHRVYEQDKNEQYEPDPNLRVLEVRKANWSVIGKSISMNWHQGVFKPDMVEVEQQQKQSPAEVLAADMEEVLRLFDSLVPGDHVSPRPNAPNNIVARFAKKSRRFRGHRARLEAAIEKLYADGTLGTIQEGSPSRRTFRVVRT